MTKPIEGWVEIYGNEPYIFCDGHTKDGEPFARRLHVHLDDPEFLSSARFRPVRITFTDEEAVTPLPDYEESVTKYKRLDVVRNDQYDKQVADAVREERERIWEEFKDLWPYELNDRARKMIFGEEK